MCFEIHLPQPAFPSLYPSWLPMCHGIKRVTHALPMDCPSVPRTQLLQRHLPLHPQLQVLIQNSHSFPRSGSCAQVAVSTWDQPPPHARTPVACSTPP